MRIFDKRKHIKEKAEVTVQRKDLRIWRRIGIKGRSRGLFFDGDTTLKQEGRKAEWGQMRTAL